MNYFNELSLYDIENIVKYCDIDGTLIMALVCKDFKEILINEHKKLTVTTKYITSSLSLCKYAHKYFNKNLDCLNNMNKKFSFYDYNQCETASKIGCHLCLGYAKNMGCPWDNNVSNLSALNNNLKCLKYAHIYGCELNKKTCFKSAYNGHLDCLRYCHKNNIEWDEFTCELSAQNGHLDCLIYARKNGCPWDKYKCFNVAKENNHRHILKWINL